MTINVYNKSGEIVKTATAHTIDLEFGTVRSIMEILKIDTIEDTTDLLKVIYNAWDSLVVVLSQIFPDMTPEDFEHVKVKELVPVIMDVLKYSFSEILGLPSDSKN